MPFLRRLSTIGALVAACLAFAPPLAAAPDDEPVLRSDVTSIEADDQLHWSVPLLVDNPTRSGFYLDSLWVEVEDLDPGETRGSRTNVIPLAVLARLLPSVSAGENGFLQFEAFASSEKARLTFHLLGHGGDQRTWNRTLVVQAAPGPLSARYPSTFLTVAGRKVETVLVPSSRDGASPGVLLIHGHGSHARKMLRVAEGLAGRGFAVMVVSMPGYGQSEGSADFMGPATMQAAVAALEALKKSPGVDPTRLGVWGLSRGATVAMELAQRRADVRAVVGQSGVYDLWSVYRGTRLAGFPETIVAEAGRDSAGWKERSPAAQPTKSMKAAVLVLHGEKDTNVPVDQAKAWVARLEKSGVATEGVFLPQAEHNLPIGIAQRRAGDFLAKELLR